MLDPLHFFRINRKFIVNKKYIKEIVNGSEIISEHLISNDLKISRVKRKIFMTWFEN